MPYKNMMFLGLIMMSGAYTATAQSPAIAVPNNRQIAWQQAEMGVVFHYDLNVFDTAKYKQSDNRIRPIPDYNIFNPAQLDVEQWVVAAKAAGARFALLTATHETGFAL
ncbi:MAG TPA: alpha-L-fucosidase, partial [Agriterribacter sp.]|nr:alpha-L-fucosidase [Agriterribacter sp.]